MEQREIAAVLKEASVFPTSFSSVAKPPTGLYKEMIGSRSGRRRVGVGQGAGLVTNGEAKERRITRFQMGVSRASWNREILIYEKTGRAIGGGLF